MRRVLVTSLFVLMIAPGALAQSNDFHWSGQIQRGKAIEVKGVNGSVRAEFTSGNQVEVTAVKTARRSDLNSVSVQVVQEDGNVTVCAVYPTLDRRYRGSSSRNGRDDGPNECRPGSAGHMNVDDFREVQIVNSLPDGIAFKGERVVCVLRWIGECTFPKAFGISGLFPDAMIAFVDGTAQRNSGALDGSDVITEVHQKRGVPG